MDNVSSTPYVAEPFQVDFNGKLFMSVLGNNLLNTAGFHANDRGFGIATLNQSKYTWVLSRFVIEMNEMPSQYEHYSIETWIEKVFRFFTNRNFAIKGDGGKVYGYAKSIWAMISLDTRKPEDLLVLHGGSIVNYVVPEKECPIDPPGRVKVTDAEPVFTYRSCYSDIDVNRHFNSVKYIEHALDLYDEELFSGKEVKEMEVVFLNETLAGTNMAFCKENGIVDIKNADNGDSLCRLSFKFS